jgi:hypothetical protein
MHGALPTAIIGGAAMLLSRRALEAMEFPYFNAMWTDDRKWLGEDVWASRNLRRGGIELFCDVDLWINHAVQGYVQPLYNPDAEQWVALGHGVQPTMCPALSRPLSEYQQDQVFARHAEKAEQQENDDDV